MIGKGIEKAHSQNLEVGSGGNHSREWPGTEAEIKRKFWLELLWQNWTLARFPHYDCNVRGGGGGGAAPSAPAISKFENFGSQGVILDGFKKTELRFLKNNNWKNPGAAFRHLDRWSQSSNWSTQHKKVSDFVSMCMFQVHNHFHGEVNSTLFPTMPKSAYPQVSWEGIGV